VAAGWLAMVPAAHGQNRGVYPLGLSAISSGVMAAAGFTYSNSFLFYGRDESKGANGELIATGAQSVLMDMNGFTWVSDRPLAMLGGATLAAGVTVPIANNSLSSSELGAISGGGGLADTYLQPLILGWRRERVDIRATLGALAPTRRYTAGAKNNVGNGYWSLTPSLGETVYLFADRSLALSAFEMYEFHTRQPGTDIQPGQTFDLDYSLMLALPAYKERQFRLGLVGYAAWQMTDTTGPQIAPAQAAQHYRIHALGVGATASLPKQGVNLSFKYFDEYSNRSTYQGSSVQIGVAVAF
jgi:hypothetical protein